MIVKLYNDNPSQRDISRICDALESGGVVIYPTDSVYAFGCSIRSSKGLDTLKRLCGKNTSELTVACENISQIAEFCRVDNATFKILKRNLPGAITFILKASSHIPEKLLAKRKSIGVRIPDNTIAQAIIEQLGMPLITASVKSDEEEEYTTNPELIHETWGHVVDYVIDGGIASITPTTIVDLSDGDVILVREGETELK